MENPGLPRRERGLGVSGAFLPARPPPTPFWSQQTDGHVLVVLRVLCNMNELKKKKKNGFLISAWAPSIFKDLVGVPGSEGPPTLGEQGTGAHTSPSPEKPSFLL